MNANSTASVRVEGDDDGVVAHVGLHALGCFGDRLGLGEALSAATTKTGERDVIIDRGEAVDPDDRELTQS